MTIYTIIPRNGTLSAFTALNRIYAKGELLLEEQVDGRYKIKIGNATSSYTTLPYVGSVDGSSAFGTLAISGQSDIVADSASSTLNITSTNGISVTTNATTDTITLSNVFGTTGGTVCQGDDSRLIGGPSFVTPQQFGAVADGIENDTSAIQSAVDTGKYVRIPKGTYRVTTSIIIDQKTGQIIRGDGVWSTLIKWEGTSGNCFELRTCSHSAIRDLMIQQVGTPSSGFGVAFIKTGAVGCFRCYIDGVRIEGLYGAVDVSRSTETRIRDCDFRDIKGPIGIFYHGTGPGVDACYRLIIEDIACDNPGGNISTSWIVMDSYAYSLVVDKAALLSAARGLYMRDSSNTGSSYPVWIFCWDVECDHNNYEGVLLERGEGCFINGSWVGSALTGNGIAIASTFRGEVFIGSGTRVYGNAQHGILFNAGPVDITINGALIGDNSVSSAGQFHGITVGANTSRFSIIGNRSGDMVGVAGNNQGYGIYIATGTSNTYIVQGNICSGNISGGIADGGSGSNKSILGNIA